MYLKAPLKGEDDYNVLQTIHSRDSRAKVANTLSGFKGDKVSGFDGVIFYELKNNEIIFIHLTRKNLLQFI